MEALFVFTFCFTHSEMMGRMEPQLPERLRGTNQPLIIHFDYETRVCVAAPPCWSVHTHMDVFMWVDSSQFPDPGCFRTMKLQFFSIVYTQILVLETQ